MTMDQKITMLGNMLGDEDIDQGVLEVYLELAGQAILNRMYPYKTDYTGLEVPDRYVATQLKIANMYINKRGAESEIQHIENGIHRNYGASDIPDSMLKDIVPFCQAIR